MQPLAELWSADCKSVVGIYDVTFRAAEPEYIRGRPGYMFSILRAIVSRKVPQKRQVYRCVTHARTC